MEKVRKRKPREHNASPAILSYVNPAIDLILVISVTLFLLVCSSYSNEFTTGVASCAGTGELGEPDGQI